MTESSLETTNVLLGIMAAVSVIQLIALAVAAVLGYRAYSRVMHTVESLEARHVAPLASRTSAILDDVKSFTARAENRADSLDQQLTEGARRAGEVAHRIRSAATRGSRNVQSVAAGVREGIAALLSGRNDKGMGEVPRRSAL